MLKYVPHVRDLEDSEERQYNLWLQELDEMDEASGFKPQSREQRAANTKRDECAARLAALLPSWLKTLSIEGCTKATLIRYMASQARDDTITPQQKSSILDTCRQVEDVGSPRAVRAAKLFTEAFDMVFSQLYSNYPVTLRDVLFRDEFVDQIVDPKRLTKESAAPSKPTEAPEPVDGGYLETHSLLACLICFCNSCDHGEYDNKNQKRTFSMEVMGGVEGALKRRPLRQGRDRATQEEKVLYSQPCGAECFRLVDPHAPPQTPKSWTPREDRILRALVETSLVGPSFRPPECTVSGLLQRPCWEVHLKLTQDSLAPKGALPPTSPKPVVKNLPWYDRFRKMLIGDWQEHTKIYEHQRRELLEPCAHDGPCTLAKGCPCVEAGVLCDRFCRCTAETCAYKFTGCACHSLGKTCYSKQKERPCICVQLNRECDPVLCKGCGAMERVDPENVDDDELHETGCQNCALQRGRSKRLILGKSLLENCGYGLFTAEDIAQDEFVIEYVGELITHDEGVRREARRGDVFNEGSNASYLFTLLEDEGIWVDAAVYGNLSRYINHASESDKRACNIMPKILYVNGEYRIRFTAMRDISAGEELFFNYGENFPNLTKKLLEDRADQQDEPLAAANKAGPSLGRKPGRRPGRPRRGGGRKPAKQNATGGGRKGVAPADPAVDWELPGSTGFALLQKNKRKRREEDEESRGELDDDDEDNIYDDDSQEGSDWEAGGRRGGRRGGGRRGVRTRKRTKRTHNKGGEKDDEEMLVAMDSPSRPPRRTGAGRPKGPTKPLRVAVEEVDESDDAHISDSDDMALARRRRGRGNRKTVVDDSVDEGGDTIVLKPKVVLAEEAVEKEEEKETVNVNVETAIVARPEGEVEVEDDEDESESESESVDGEEEEDSWTPSRSKSTRKVQVPARYRDETE